jgi:hypothetical protein
MLNWFPKIAKQMTLLTLVWVLVVPLTLRFCVVFKRNKGVKDFAVASKDAVTHFSDIPDASDL